MLSCTSLTYQALALQLPHQGAFHGALLYLQGTEISLDQLEAHVSPPRFASNFLPVFLSVVLIHDDPCEKLPTHPPNWPAEF